MGLFLSRFKCFTVGLPVTSLALATLPISITLMSAALQGVSYKGWLTPADRPVILTNLTVSVLATGSTDLSSGESPAASEGVPSGSSWASAYGNMVLDTAVSTLSTCEAAGVHTFVVFAGPLVTTVTVLITLSLDA